MDRLEQLARCIAAQKMGLVKDGFGLRLPDDLWKQAIPHAQRHLEGEAQKAWETEAAKLRNALVDLVLRCDGDEGVRADGSNIDTLSAHAALGWLKEEPDEG